MTSPEKKFQNNVRKLQSLIERVDVILPRPPNVQVGDLKLFTLKENQVTGFIDIINALMVENSYLKHKLDLYQANR